MSENTNKSQVITEYLLGALSESETERLDELSFTDDQFAESLLSAEKDLVDAYVQGELSGAELERFTAYYLSTPLRREKVAFARAFQSSGERSAAVDSAVKAATEPRRSKWFSVFSIFSGQRLAWGFAALALVLLIAGGLLIFQNLRLRQEMSQAQARRDALSQREQELETQLSGERSAKEETEKELARVREELARLENERGLPQPSPGRSSPVFSFVLRPPVRGVGNVPSFSVPAKTQTVSIQLGVESTSATAYQVSLIDPSSQLLWRSDTLKLRAKDRNLKISFAANLLKPQTYILQVMAIRENGTSEIVGDYPFRVVR